MAYRNPFARVLAPATKIVTTDTADIQMNVVNFAKRYFFNIFLLIFCVSFRHKGAKMHEKSQFMA